MGDGKWNLPKQRRKMHSHLPNSGLSTLSSKLKADEILQMGRNLPLFLDKELSYIQCSEREKGNPVTWTLHLQVPLLLVAGLRTIPLSITSPDVRGEPWKCMSLKHLQKMQISNMCFWTASQRDGYSYISHSRGPLTCISPTTVLRTA